MRILKAFVFLIVLSLLCSISYGQTWNNNQLGNTTTMNNQKGGVGSDLIMIVPLDSNETIGSNVRKNGRIAVMNGLFTWYDSLNGKWQVAASGVPTTPDLQQVTDVGNATSNYIRIGRATIQGEITTDSTVLVMVRDTGSCRLRMWTGGTLTTTNNLAFFVGQGSVSSPTAVKNNRNIYCMNPHGWDGDNWHFSGGFVYGTAEDWSLTNHGTQAWQKTTKSGASNAAKFRWWAMGTGDLALNSEESSVLVGTSTNNGTGATLQVENNSSFEGHILYQNPSEGDLDDSTIVFDNDTLKKATPVNTALANYQPISTAWLLAGNTGSGKILGTIDANNFLIESNGDTVFNVGRHVLTADTSTTIKTVQDSRLILQSDLALNTGISGGSAFIAPSLVESGFNCTLGGSSLVKAGHKFSFGVNNSAGHNYQLLVTDTVATSGTGQVSGIYVRRRLDGTGTGNTYGVHVQDLLGAATSTQPYIGIRVDVPAVTGYIGFQQSGSGAINEFQGSSNRFANLPTYSSGTYEYVRRNTTNNSQLEVVSAIPVADVTGAQAALTFSTGLTNTANTITNNVSTGVSGGQTINGGTGANEDLTIEGTTNGTKTSSVIIMQPTGGNVTIGNASLGFPFEVRKDNNGSAYVGVTNGTNGTSALAGIVVGNGSVAGTFTYRAAAYTDDPALANKVVLRSDGGTAGFNIVTGGAADPIIMQTNGTTRLTVADAAVTSTVPVTATSFIIGTTKWSVGSGDPNGVLTGSPGDIYSNTAGGAGTTLYIKESGSATNTGWVGK